MIAQKLKFAVKIREVPVGGEVKMSGKDYKFMLEDLKPLKPQKYYSSNFYIFHSTPLWFLKNN